MSELSPAAQAVVTALNTAQADTRLMAAAALRAARRAPEREASQACAPPSFHRDAADPD